MLNIRHLSLLPILALAFLLPACSSIEYPPDQAPHMVVENETAPFFLHGPAQSSGADRTLAKGDEVQVLRKEFGYSFVQLGDGSKGYVANELLVIAPPMPSPTPRPKKRASSVFPEEPDASWGVPGFRY